jgi:hypothetical protein
VLRPRIFLGGQAVSMLGDGLAALAIPLLVLQLTGSPVAAALASAPRSIGYLVAGLPAGVLRLGARLRSGRAGQAEWLADDQRRAARSETRPATA